MIFLIVLLCLSVFLNICFIYRFIKHEGTFWIDTTTREQATPILKVNFDEVLDQGYFVVKVLKEENRK